MNSRTCSPRARINNFFSFQGLSVQAQGFQYAPKRIEYNSNSSFWPPEHQYVITQSICPDFEYGEMITIYKDNNDVYHLLIIEVCQVLRQLLLYLSHF
jgi:hypothetical protein